MELQLDDVEARVLGCLLEKEAATPEYYPLSLNALVNACNQKSNREPVVSYDEGTVESALDRLRDKGLAVRITGSDMRVPKHGHRLADVFNLGRRESAVLSVLLLRGPQTPGELRGRTERLHHFDDLDGVESTLNRLMEWQPEPLATRLARQAGSREPRYAHLLSGPPAPAEAEAAPPPRRAQPSEDELRQLSSAIEGLQRDVAEIKKQLENLRKLS
ncbi:MAG TPA: YceH family protein [Bryobacteraceae bacterium]|nr:YceH family protein [Bryobacteraceae bacterium]